MIARFGEFFASFFTQAARFPESALAQRPANEHGTAYGGVLLSYLLHRSIIRARQIPRLDRLNPAQPWEATLRRGTDCKEMRKMCLTGEALALFLNLLDPGLISSDAGRIIVHATEGQAVWVLTDADGWCTMAPQIDRLARFG
ncbi:MAG: hypothetical protein P1U75_10355 [Antarcticimicrobium sp.]|uniref:hypothetical protein n=1 Tax=Antarcticimicrobium sp. TaxID=2824147 RepID=UPI002611B612|nr:hypothetical protein [Antarcticimicrobium sp.]MDF1717052.1 hypothetical protein [Antarcticimicrobium sp.]